MAAAPGSSCVPGPFTYFLRTVSYFLRQRRVELNVQVTLEGLGNRAALLRRTGELLQLRRVEVCCGHPSRQPHGGDPEPFAGLLDRAGSVRLDALRRRPVPLELAAQRHAEARGVRCREKFLGVR